MLRLIIRGKIEKVIFRSEASSKFIITDEGGSRIVGTLTKKYIDFAEMITEGKKYEVIGELTLYEKKRDERVFRENTFYVQSIEEIENI